MPEEKIVNDFVAVLQKTVNSEHGCFVCQYRFNKVCNKEIAGNQDCMSEKEACDFKRICHKWIDLAESEDIRMDRCASLLVATDILRKQVMA